VIQHDRISQLMIILGTCIFIYLFTIVQSSIVLFPLILMLSGMVLHRFVQGKNKDQDDFDETPISDEHLWKNLLFYTVVALFGVFVVSEAISVLPLDMNSGLTGFYSLLYLVLIGIAEEEFFRGFITDWLLSSLPNPYLAILVSAAFFTIYHFAVYGTVFASLIYVFGGGFILSWVVYRTRHISPCIMGHMINNLGAFVGSSSKIGASASIILIQKIVSKVV
jgi:membrane protease YdiL (CAAX protease family)